MDLWEFEVSLVYKVNLRPVKATQRNSISKKQNKTSSLGPKQDGCPDSGAFMDQMWTRVPVQTKSGEDKYNGLICAL